MEVIFIILMIVFACLILAKSADLVVNSVVRIAKILHISDFNIGFFILGMCTTSPEIFIGLSASLNNKSDISLGNLMGASLMLMTLIIGANAIINKEVYFIKSFRLIDVLLTSLIIVFPIPFMLDKNLSRLDGMILILGYLLFVVVMNMRHTFIENIHQITSHHHFRKIVLWLILGIIGLIIGAKIAVFFSEFIAIKLGIPLLIIGLLLIPIGTNLPEITVMLTAIKKKHNQVGVGDFLGSAVANTPVLGIMTLINPIKITDFNRLILTFILLLSSLILFNLFFYFKKKLTRIEGIIFVSIYLFFIFSHLFFAF